LTNENQVLDLSFEKSKLVLREHKKWTLIDVNDDL